MKLNYKDYLATLQNIDNPQSMSWDGDLFLPPCNCSSTLTLPTTQPIHCNADSSPTKFDFNSTNEIDIKDLTNLRKYINPGSKSRSQISYWLCNKYSLCNLPLT